ncbi:MAG: fatty acid desaturase [Verrucomicrobiota bacterium]|nr:fatty acid desaturase [Verrucomicrobiota bacterium]
MSFSISKWVCPPPETFDSPEGEEGPVEWLRCLPFVLIHIAALSAFFFPLLWPGVLLAIFSYTVRMFCITAFYHRYFSHRAFKTSRFVQFAGAFVACSAGQRGPLWWAAHHRRHHRHSDTEYDVHSPKKRSLFWSHMLWFMTEYSVPTFLKEVKDLLKFPELRFLNRYDWIPVVALAASCYGLGSLSFFQTATGLNGVTTFIWGFLIPTIFLYHGTFAVNSLAHLFGRKRYKTDDESRNNLWIALFTLGEGWHNNHHFYPISARQGFFAWEIDLTYYLLKLLSLFGIVRDLRPVPAWVKEKGRS